MTQPPSCQVGHVPRWELGRCCFVALDDDLLGVQARRRSSPLKTAMPTRRFCLPGPRPMATSTPPAIRQGGRRPDAGGGGGGRVRPGCRSHLAVCLNFNLHPGLAPLHLWQCTHFGAPLATGSFYKDQIACPWHCASFCVKTGDIEDAPALVSLPGQALLVMWALYFSAHRPLLAAVSTTGQHEPASAATRSVLPCFWPHQRLCAVEAAACRSRTGDRVAFRCCRPPARILLTLPSSLAPCARWRGAMPGRTPYVSSSR